MGLHCYVHIPFCRTRCVYCDFFLVTRQDLQERFFRALYEETVARLTAFRGRTVQSVHFGGGTPSFVCAGYLKQWLETVAHFISLSDDAEITVEANPEDLTPKKFRDLAALGVNRLSIGVQSFLPGKLGTLGRCHTAEDAVRVTREAMKRFGNVSVDLMCGAEGETAEEWLSDLQCALSIGVPHISIYMLALEKKTLLAQRVKKGLVTLPGEEKQAEMYTIACELLGEQGFEHYEVSNFSKPGFFSRYNLGCWHRESYLGFGPSAHSFCKTGEQERRSANVSSMMRYLASPLEAQAFSEMLSEEARINEQVFLSMRLSSGLGLDFLQRHHKDTGEILETVEKFRAQGLLDVRNGIVKVSQKGFLFADLVAEELMLMKKVSG